METIKMSHVDYLLTPLWNPVYATVYMDVYVYPLLLFSYQFWYWKIAANKLLYYILFHKLFCIILFISLHIYLYYIYYNIGIGMYMRYIWYEIICVQLRLFLLWFFVWVALFGIYIFMHSGIWLTKEIVFFFHPNV